MSRSRFNHDLSEVEAALVQMHGAVDHALGRALVAFEYGQREAAQALIRDDAAINERWAAVEAAVMSLIAREQPLTHDLRLCVAAWSIATDLERIGDYAAGIGSLVLRDPTPPAPTPELHELAAEVRTLLRQSIVAVVEHDAATAHRLVAADDAIDAHYARMLEACKVRLAEDQPAIRRHLYTLFVAHNFERIADRAVNIAERAAWVATGQRWK